MEMKTISNKLSVHSDLLKNQVILRVSLRRTFLSKRGVVSLIIMFIFSIYPIIGIYSAVFNHNKVFKQGAMWGFHDFFASFYEFILIPLLISIFASYIISDDIEDKTMTYWLVRPIKRSEIYASKIIALFIGSSIISIITLTFNFLCFYIIAKIFHEFVDWRLYFLHLLLVLLITLYFTAITGLISIIAPLPVLISMIYFVVWEIAVYSALSDMGVYGLNWIFFHSYVNQFIHYIANTIFGFNYKITMSVGSIIVVPAIISLLFIVLAVYKGINKEYP